MSAPDPPGPDPDSHALLKCSGCGWDIDCLPADASRYRLKGCPLCGSPVADVTPPAPGGGKNKRLVPRRVVRGGVRVEVRRGVMGLGPDLALGPADLSEDGVGVRVKVALQPREECEVVLVRVGGKPTKVHAEVRWCAPAPEGGYRVGLKFQRRLARKDLLDLSK